MENGTDALVWELRKSLSQEVTFELMVQWQGVFSHVKIRGLSVTSRGNGRCNGPNERMNLTFLRNNTKGNVMNEQERRR